MQILSFPIFQLQEMNLQSCGEWCAVSIGQVWFRTSHVICYCYVIISSCTVHEAENNSKGGLYLKHAAWCNNYVSKIMKELAKKNQIIEIMEYLSNKVKGKEFFL